MDHHVTRFFNMVVCGAVVVYALYFFYTARGHNKALGPQCINNAFCWWWLNWVLVTIVYINITFNWVIPKAGTLFILNLSALFSLRFFFQYIPGDHMTKQSNKYIKNILTVILSICLLLAILGCQEKSGKLTVIELLQIALSELLSTVSVLLVGWAFFLRYYKREKSWLAIFLLIITCVYALFQLPAYTEVFVLGGGAANDSNPWIESIMVIVAVMKLVKAILSFLLFRSPFWWESDTSGNPIRTDPTYIDRAELWPGAGDLPHIPDLRDPLTIFDPFVLMPLADELRPIYVDHIKPIANGLGLRAGRGDEFLPGGTIMEQIWWAIRHCRIVIVECTGLNPNVFYELGLAHARGKQPLLIARSDVVIPYDVIQMRVIKYDPGKMDEFNILLRDTLKLMIEKHW